MRVGADVEVVKAAVRVAEVEGCGCGAGSGSGCSLCLHHRRRHRERRMWPTCEGALPGAAAVPHRILPLALPDRQNGYIGEAIAAPGLRPPTPTSPPAGGAPHRLRHRWRAV